MPLTKRVARAAEVLASGTGVVLVEGIVALRPSAHELLCEVIDPIPSAHRCANEYKALIENTQRALETSKLGSLLPDLPRKWLVVEEFGIGTMEICRAP